jgi:hypothetical protein
MTLTRACCICALLAAMTASAQPPAPAQPPVNRPFAARRVVYQFDFEPDAREVFELPRYWDLAQDGSRSAGSRPGFPAWNSARLAVDAAFAGSGAVKLTTQGGSVSLRLEPGVVPVFPGTEYLVSARLQTRGLVHARAGLIARYLDKANKPIPGASSRSELVSSAGTEWTLITASLPGNFPGAAYVQIDLEILQPEQFAHTEHDKHQVWKQDFTGSAWFDQVAVVQLPRAAISTPSPINILRAPQRPRVSVMLRDLTGEQITGILTLQDAAGRTVDETSRALSGGVWDWEPKVAEFGWYRATLELRTGDRRIGATYVDLTWLPEIRGHSTSSDSGKFSVILNTLPADRRPLLPEFVEALGASGGAVTIPVWNERTTPADIDLLCRDLIPVLERLRATQSRVAFSLPRIPDALAADLRLEASHPLLAFVPGEKVWGPYLVPLLDKFGQSVQRWQIGSIGGIAGPIDVAHAAAARASGVLSSLVPGPLIELPWPGEQGPLTFTGTDVGLVVSVPTALHGAGLTDFATQWLVDKGPPPTLVLNALSNEFSRLDSCIGLVKQGVQLWTARQANPPTLAIVEPWEWTGPSGGPPMPRPELAAWANLAERLRDRRAAGRLEPRPGVSCIILAPTASSSRSGALVLWRDSPDVRDPFLSVYLGDAPVDVVDLFGNRQSLAPGPVDGASRGGTGRAKSPVAHRLPVTDSPLFIENVDVDLAIFAASFRLEPPFAATSTNEHEIAMLLSNPWKSRVEGRITVLEPGGLSSDGASRDRSWRITPRSSAFTMGPGELARIPVSVAFSPVEEAGPKDFLVEIEVAGTRDYSPIRLHTTLEIGVSDFQVELTYRISSGTDVAIEVHVTNRGKETASYELSGFAEGYPRGKVYISDLPPGALATRRLAFPGGAATLRGQRVAVGVQDVTTQSRATRSVLIE